MGVQRKSCNKNVIRVKYFMIVSSTRRLQFAQENVALLDFKLMTPPHGLMLRAVAVHLLIQLSMHFSDDV